MERSILCLAGNNYNVVEVLGCTADERYTAYVNLLNDVGVTCARSNSLLKRIEVNNYQVNLRNLLLRHLLLVLLKFSASQYAAEHFRVKCLHATAQD